MYDEFIEVIMNDETQKNDEKMNSEERVDKILEVLDEQPYSVVVAVLSTVLVNIDYIFEKSIPFSKILLTPSDKVYKMAKKYAINPKDVEGNHDEQ